MAVSDRGSRRPCRPQKGTSKDDYDSSWAVAECRDCVAIATPCESTGLRFVKALVVVSLMQYACLEFETERDEIMARAVLPREDGFYKLLLERKHKHDIAGGWYVCHPTEYQV
jgi:hypothetical protein